MPETQTPGNAAAAPAKPAPPPLMTTAELLKEVAANGNGSISAPASTPIDQLKTQTSSDATAATSSVEPSSKGEAGEPSTKVPNEDGDTRLARLAAAQRRLDKQRAELEAREKALNERAAAANSSAESWQKLQDAKTRGDRLGALKVLFDDGELTEKVYWDLNDYILKNHKEPTQEEIIARTVEAKVAEARKAEQEAQRKADETAAATTAESVRNSETQYIQSAAAVFNASPDRWPHVKAMGITDRDILAYVQEQFKAKNDVPAEADVLNHFEAQLKAKVDSLRPAEPRPAGLPKSVSGSWGADSPLKAAKDMTIEEITELAKREAGVIK